MGKRKLTRRERYRAKLEEQANVPVSFTGLRVRLQGGTGTTKTIGELRKIVQENEAFNKRFQRSISNLKANGIKVRINKESQ